MKLNQVRDNEGARKSRTRVARGIGSGKGRTAGRGVKGQGSRSGVAINGFEGGQMPIYRRLPKRGFNNIFRLEYVEVNLGRLQQAVDEGALDATKEIDVVALMEAGIIRRAKDGLRVLGSGNVKTALKIKAAGASAAAKAAVEKAGGELIIEEKKAPFNPKAAKKA